MAGRVYSLPILAASPAARGGDPLGVSTATAVALSTESARIATARVRGCDVGRRVQGPSRRDGRDDSLEQAARPRKNLTE